MAKKKHLNDDKPPGYGGKSVSGKGSGKPGDNAAKNRGGGERNVGKSGSEEHSRSPKGNRG